MFDVGCPLAGCAFRAGSLARVVRAADTRAAVLRVVAREHRGSAARMVLADAAHAAAGSGSTSGDRDFEIVAMKEEP